MIVLQISRAIPACIRNIVTSLIKTMTLLGQTNFWFLKFKINPLVELLRLSTEFKSVSKSRTVANTATAVNVNERSFTIIPLMQG